MRYWLTFILVLWGALAWGDELIIFHMPGCRPCAQLKQMLDQSPELVQGFRVSRIDIDADPESAEIFNVSSVPTVVRLDDKDKEIARSAGLLSRREFINWLENPSTTRSFRRTRL
jgi:thioredoxin-like negative regulator of GroEL